MNYRVTCCKTKSKSDFGKLWIVHFVNKLNIFEKNSP
jgi:hypothetical protein